MIIVVASSAILLFLFGLWKLYEWLQPPAHPPSKNPGALELIFDNRFLITATRFAIVVGGAVLVVYAIASVVKLMMEGRWLVSFGRFGVTDQVTTIAKDRAELRAAVEEAQREKDATEQRLEELNQLLQELAQGGPQA